MSETDPAQTDPATAAADAPPGEIVARHGRYYRNARYVMALVCFAMAGWFAYDGWVKYPAQNVAYDQMIARGEKPSYTRNKETDIDLQRRLAMALPFAGVGIIAWLLYRSRGEYRLAGDVLHVPGHPPIPLDAITEIDKTKWDKKGIAYLDYETTDPKTNAVVKATATLDDFLYEQKPTDKIVETIEKKLAPPAEEGEESADAEAEETPTETATDRPTRDA